MIFKLILTILIISNRAIIIGAQKNDLKLNIREIPIDPLNSSDCKCTQSKFVLKI